MKESKYKVIISIVTFALFFLALVYLVKGFYTLAFDSSREGARDLLERWKEQQYIYRGIYPYDMNPAEIDPQLGKLRSGGYPPWAFFTGFWIFPPIDWTLTRFYHAFLNLLSLSILVRFAYQTGIPFGSRAAYFFIGACLAISSHCTTLNNGQYGIIINALLIGVFWLLDGKKNYLSGLIMGIALAKPSISASYLLILIVKRKFQAFLMTLFYLLVAIFAVGRLTRLSFFEIFGRFFSQIKYVADDGFSGIDVLLYLGLKVEVTAVLLSLVFVSLAVAIVKWLRHFPLLTLFAVASVIGRIFFYHRSYDDLMLVFLLLALLKLTFSHPNWFNIMVLIVLGLTLWLPLSLQNLVVPYWLVLQTMVWVIALVYLLFDPFAIAKRQDKA